MTVKFGSRWTVVRPLPGGGQAVVYEVTDADGQLPGSYFLKRLANIKRIDRFRREVAVVSKLDHENVIRIVEHDLEAEKPYMVTEYCRGGNLVDALSGIDVHGDWLAREQVLRLFAQVCDGLAAAHNEGVVHRDIKPENVLLRGLNGPAVVADFGMCFTDDDTRLTETLEQVGARFFIAPELENGRAAEVTPAADVYSLGKLLYWMLSGGKRLSRERFREPDFNLVDLFDDPKLEHVNRLLDQMIKEKPADRLQQAAGVAREARMLADLLRHGYNAPSGTLPQQCIYCGRGPYWIVGQDKTAATNFGFANVQWPGMPGPSDWRILVCQSCGNVQVFRLEFAGKRERWSKP